MLSKIYKYKDDMINWERIPRANLNRFRLVTVTRPIILIIRTKSKNNSVGEIEQLRKKYGKLLTTVFVFTTAV